MEKNTKKILVIEDDNSIRLSLTCFIEDLGYNVFEAVDGVEGFQIIKDELPDLVITDLRMPRMTGIELLKKVKKQFKNIPVIVLSGTGNIKDVVYTLKYGANDYLLKPIPDLKLLEKAITNTLEISEFQRAKEEYSANLEILVKEKTKELNTTKQQLLSIVSTVPDIIYRLDNCGNLVFVSDAVRDYGYTPEEILGENIFNFIHPDDRKKAFNRINERRTGERGTKSLELRFLTKTKEILHFDLKSRGINKEAILELDAEGLYSDGQFIGTQGIARDITEIVKSRERTKKLEEQLFHAEKMESISRLAGGIAHDFNNILVSIIGYSEMMMQRHKDESTKDGKAAYIINVSAHRAADLTKQLIGLSRDGKFSPASVNINKLIEDNIKFSEFLLRNSIEIKKKLRKISYAVADKSQIDRVITNLLINAKDAMPDGGSITIETDSVHPDDNIICLIPELEKREYIRISVSDTGTGMPKSVSDKIFEPFYSTKGEGKGTGLGLANAYRIIKQHCGLINVNSEVGFGSTFNIYLPSSTDNIVQSTIKSKTNINNNK